MKSDTRTVSSSASSEKLFDEIVQFRPGAITLLSGGCEDLAAGGSFSGLCRSLPTNHSSALVAPYTRFGIVAFSKTLTAA